MTVVGRGERVGGRLERALVRVGGRDGGTALSGAGGGSPCLSWRGDHCRVASEVPTSQSSDVSEAVEVGRWPSGATR